MIIFKGCPRCRGDLVLDRDRYGAYLECFQCAYLVDQDSGALVLRIVPVSSGTANERQLHLKSLTYKPLKGVET